MTKSMLLFGLLILNASVCSEAGGYGVKRQQFSGRIAAYRLADRLQVGSFASNKEMLLFQTTPHPHQLIKLIYEHQGYSDLKDDVLSGASGILVTVRRDRSCDQSLGAFERDALAVPVEGGGSSDAAKPITFALGAPQLPKAYPLKCYVLQEWSLAKGSRR